MLMQKLLRPKQLMMLRAFLAQLMGKNCASSACKSFLFLFLFIMFFNTIYRGIHKDSPYKVHGYSITTATSTLQSHLLKNHVDEWVSGCKELNIVPRGKEGEEAMAKVMGLPVQHLAEARELFSQQAFINALVQFIVAPNQVFHFIYFFSYYFILFLSLLEL